MRHTYKDATQFVANLCGVESRLTGLMYVASDVSLAQEYRAAYKPRITIHRGAEDSVGQIGCDVMNQQGPGVNHDA